ncbi:MAG: YigZ family protein [bacterium]|nr:YigZ family protein [bacterium]
MSSPDHYHTLSSSARSELRVKASRFFGFAESVPDEAAAAAMRVRLKKEYHDASHQPFAYRLCDGSERCSDDGEPKGTSGQAILLEIRRAEVSDVQVVVVRYFGGTKLGKGGLSRTFSDCAREALVEGGRILVTKSSSFSIILTPEDVKTAKAIALEFSAVVETQSYDPLAHLKIVVPESRIQDCRQALLDRFGKTIITES